MSNIKEAISKVPIIAKKGEGATHTGVDDQQAHTYRANANASGQPDFSAYDGQLAVRRERVKHVGIS